MGIPQPARIASAVLCTIGVWAFSQVYAVANSHVSLTAMTYNIGSAAGIPLGPEQMAQIAQEIKDAQADVVGMTEVDIGTYRHDYRDMVSEIEVELNEIGYPMYHYYTPIASFAAGSMVLVIWSRYPIVETDYRVTLPEGPEDRKVARARIVIDCHTAVDCFMTHYFIGDGSLHQQQTDIILDYVHSFQGPRVLMGDFNFTPDSIYYDQVIASGLEDACIAAGVGHLPTVGSGAGIVAPPRLYQIDFVFGSPDIDWYDAFVPDTTVSDHWPLAARGMVAVPPPMVATTPAGLLTAGWNLLSLPLDPVDPDPAQVFKDDQGDPIAISGSLVRYDRASRSYRTYHDAAPEEFGDLQNGEGYWLYLSAPTNLSYSGHASIAFRYDLVESGWHLIGCPSVVDVPLDLVLISREGEPGGAPICLGVGILVKHWLNPALYWYDSAAGSYAACGFYQWHATHALQPWRGYWAHTNTDGLTVMLPP